MEITLYSARDYLLKRFNIMPKARQAIMAHSL